MLEVVFVFVAARSLAESCGEICGGAGLGGAGSAVSGGAGRGRGGAGRLAGAGGGSGRRSFRRRFRRGCSPAEAFPVAGMGGVSSGGGVLTEGGAARTICLLAHPAVARTAHKQHEKLDFSHYVSAPRPRPDRAGGTAQAPFDAPAATRFETSCRAPLPT